MKILTTTLLAVAIAAACAPAFAGETCVLDDGFGGTNSRLLLTAPQSEA